MGEGFLGELACLTLSFGDDADGRATLIAKIPTSDSGLKPIGLTLQLYEREARPYTGVIPQLEVRTASALCNEMDVEANGFCLILEDIVPRGRGDVWRSAW